MPTLPTFTVSDAVGQRILAAFSNQTDVSGEPLTPQQAYKAWLKRELIGYVAAQETDADLDAELS